MSFKTLLSLAVLAVAAQASSTAALAQVRINGAVQGHDFLGRPVAPDEFQIVHGSEFKGAQKVAISVFEVAFPSENHFTNKSGGRLGNMIVSKSSSMSTTMTGVDKATQQRIADKAYARFIAQLKAAGYEVVDRAELIRLAPEYGKLEAAANFSPGRFGAYVAPTGEQLFFLRGDTAKRDTSGFMGQQLAGFRVLDRPIAFERSPYIAHDGNVGVIAVTLVVDYGTYSSSGNKRGVKNVSGSFTPGVTIAAGNVVDSGSLIEYWGPKSGGFPAGAFLQQPIHSDAEVGTLEGAPKSGDYTMIADPAKFEAAADVVGAEAVEKLVSVMAAAK